MMENHGYSQIYNNSNAPYATAQSDNTNRVANYLAIAYPSLTNHLEIA